MMTKTVEKNPFHRFLMSRMWAYVYYMLVAMN